MWSGGKRPTESISEDNLRNELISLNLIDLLVFMSHCHRAWQPSHSSTESGFARNRTARWMYKRFHLACLPHNTVAGVFAAKSCRHHSSSGSDTKCFSNWVRFSLRRTETSDPHKKPLQAKAFARFDSQTPSFRAAARHNTFRCQGDAHGT